jgi:type IV pilus assembly protein PilA
MKKNNKGFSLVELIIVIAIMAILAGALAPALIKYIAKSRRSTDVSNAQTIATAVTNALSVEGAYDDAKADTDYTVNSSKNGGIGGGASSDNSFESEVSSQLTGTFKPKYDKGKSFVIHLDSDLKTFTVSVGGKELYPDVDNDYK